MGPMTGVRTVRSPEKTRAMNRPSGFTQASTRAKMMAICSQPIRVIDASSLEALGAQEGEQQVGAERERDGEAEDRFGHDGASATDARQRARRGPSGRRR